jgi:glycosyltransferase involved in cell wall biosynthesis
MFARGAEEQMNEGLAVSVVVPVYNSEGSLRPLVARLEKALGSVSHEIILVNDGSRDGSWSVIRSMASEIASVRGFDLMRNYGQHNALLAGIRAARGETVVTLDDDLQHPPEEIPRLLAELEKGADVVYGTPRTLPHSFLRNVASWLTKLAVQKTMGVETARKVSAFRAFRTRLRKAFGNYQSPYVSIDVLLTWATTRFTAVPVEHHRREIGRSNYTLTALVVHAFTMVTSFTTLPLRLASLIGLALTLFGLFTLTYVLAVYLTRGGSVPGFPFLASIVSIFSGAQMFALGIMGEYLARMHVRLMERPSFAIAESVGSDPP